MRNWTERPQLIDYWHENYDTIMAIDENGTTDLKGLQKNLLNIFKGKEYHDRWFTITGVIMNRSYFPSFRDNMTSLKQRFWEDGKYNYRRGLKRVVFHSREIRKKEGPFNPLLIDSDIFLSDLSNLIANAEYTVISSTIDKYNHILKYSNPYHVYKLCLEFILERYCRLLSAEGKNGLLLLESRGKKEDRDILRFIRELIEYGNKYYTKEDFSCIKGIYFNPKWDKPGNGSFISLELADLVSYPIHKAHRYGKMDKAFEVVESKLYNYPAYFGYGIKKFP